MKPLQRAGGVQAGADCNVVDAPVPGLRERYSDLVHGRGHPCVREWRPGDLRCSSSTTGFVRININDPTGNNVFPGGVNVYNLGVQRANLGRGNYTVISSALAEIPPRPLSPRICPTASR